VCFLGKKKYFLLQVNVGCPNAQREAKIGRESAKQIGAGCFHTLDITHESFSLP
jgi:hypothetical protein